MKCVPCLQGLTELCMTGGNCESDAGSEVSDVLPVLSDSDEEDYVRGPKRLRKNKATLKDPLSTGRKEAARLYPLDKERDCEWAYNSKAGGGKHPIRGCGIGNTPVGKQKHRHHGPDKNTMNNEEGNVHRICHFCHNRWHAANDDEYDPENIGED